MIKKRGLMPTYILRCSHNFPDLMAAAYQPRQAEIHNLYVPERRFAGEEDILRLEERNTPEVNCYNAGIIIYSGIITHL